MTTRLRLLVLTTTALAAQACGGGDSAGSGTSRMVDTLASLNAVAYADPMSNPFLNRARADLYRGTAAAQTGSAAMQARYLFSQEELIAGQTRDAIAGLEALIAAAGIVLDARTPQNKPFYDLLGMAYLRLGEQENCALNPGANMCILPLDGAARHERDEGARKAIALYERMLRAYPDDPGTRWLLNIAYLAVGEYPYRVPKQWLIPNIGYKRHPEFPLFHNVAGDVGVDVEGLSGGLNAEDFDGDGLVDIFTTAFGLRDPVHLFLADGTGGFRDATQRAGLGGIVGGLNTIHADYDNDGDSDILIFRGAWLGEAGAFPMSLLRNRGDATFDDVTFAAGLGSRRPRHSGAWADINLDGHLDLVVGNESGAGRGGTAHPSELFISNGDGTFQDRSRAMGFGLDAFVKGVTVGDVNNDGYPDVFASVLFGPNRLYINRGGTRFEDATAAAGVQLPIMAFPTWFWDYDNDGWEDLLVLSYDIRRSGSLHDAVAMEYLGQPPTRQNPSRADYVEPSRLFRNLGNGTFHDATQETGLDDKVLYAMGSNFGDLDNDGFLDFYVGTGNPDLRSIIPNRMFRSAGGTRFEEVSLEGGFAHIQKGHAAAFVDFDGDGDQDVYMVMGGAYEGDRFRSVLFENPGWPDRSWIALELQGTTANRAALGARVAIVAVEPGGATRTIHRTIGTGGSFGAGSLRLHVGLGRAAAVKEVRVTWPDAAQSRTTYTGIEPRQTYRLVQGVQPLRLDRKAVPFRHQPNAAHAAHPKP